MDKEISTFGLKPEKLVRFLRLGRDDSQADDAGDLDRKKSDLLRDRLDSKLPSEPSAIGVLPAILQKFYQALLPQGGKTLGELLLNDKTELEVLDKIKSHGKECAAAATSRIEEDTAIMIYYAAIASALVLHNEKITQYSYAELEKSLLSLRNKSWLTPPLKELIDKAHRLCQQQNSS